MDEEEDAILSKYLRNAKVPKLLGSLSGVTNTISNKWAKEHSALLKKAKGLYPLEFAEKITIHLSRKDLAMVYNEARLTNEENLERACLLRAKIIFLDKGLKTAKVRIIGFVDFEVLKTLVHERRATGINQSRLKKFIERKTSGETKYFSVHTHTRGHIHPSVMDLDNKAWGSIDFVASVGEDDTFYLIPYRKDTVKHQKQGEKDKYAEIKKEAKLTFNFIIEKMHPGKFRGTIECPVSILEEEL